MPRKKSDNARVEILEKPARPRPTFIHRIKDLLSLVFYLEWIVIGLFFLLLISSQLRQGAFKELLSPKNTAPAVDSSQVPAETDLPGIGRVNIACVQKALKPESIQKLLQNGSANFLEGEEKTNFQTCIVSAESPTPSPKSPK